MPKCAAAEEEPATAITHPDALFCVQDHSSSDSWLCPITSTAERRGIISLSEEQYFDLVDQSGRIMRTGKKGFINPDLAPILERLGVRPESWMDTITRFGEKFHVAAGSHSNLKRFAEKIGVCWLVGRPAARSSFI